MWRTVFSMMHEPWSEHLSLACSALNLAVYKISTKNTIFQDTEKTYSMSVCVLCATWKGMFQTNTRIFSVSFWCCPFSSLSFPRIFFLSVSTSVLLFISASVFRFYSHYFSDHFCFLSFFPFSCPFFWPFFSS